MKTKIKLHIEPVGVAAGVGAGLAGVLLSMLTLQHPPITLLMGFVAPLPLMTAALAFGRIAGLFALVTGSIFIGLFDIRSGHLVFTGHQAPLNIAIDVLVFLIALGLPSLVLIEAGRARDKPATGVVPTARPNERLLGRVAAVAVFFAASAVSTVFIVAIIENGGFDAFNAIMKDAFEKIWQTLAAKRSLPGEIDASRIASELVWLMPALMSAAAVICYLCNTWLSARVAQTSNLLGMSWPDIPSNLRMPRLFAVLLAVSLGLCFTGGILGLVARTVSAALLAAFMLQGLAVLHSLTRHRGSRTAILLLVYLSTFVLLPWPLLIWGALGLVDAAFSFRDRQKPVVVRKP